MAGIQRSVDFAKGGAYKSESAGLPISPAPLLFLCHALLFTKCIMYNISAQLNHQQSAAVENIDGAVLLLAVPGSGKTTVLIARLAEMIENRGIPSDTILVLTYTVAAANEMRNRFHDMFPELEPPEFRTINGIAQKIINDFSNMTGRIPFALQTDERKTVSAIGAIYLKLNDEYPSEATISEIRRSITCIKNSMMTDEEIEKLDFGATAISKIYKAYVAYMREQRLMDYDDQLVYALSMLKNYPLLRKKYHDRFKYICVDEAQDTSKIQHCIIKLLAGSGNIFMVGDEDQSIYGFRGAYPEFLLTFSQKYKNAVILKSEENFRSVPEIVKAADGFISKNSQRIQKNMFASRTAHGEVKEIPVATLEDQYTALCGILKDADSDTAVLYRNNECALPLIDMLIKKGIPFSSRENDCTFFTSKTVTDICNILKLAHNRYDGDAFMMLYYKLGLYISKNDALVAVNEAVKKKKSVFDCLRRNRVLSQPALEKCGKIEQTLDRIKKSNVSTGVFLAAFLPGYAGYTQGTDINKTEILSILASDDKTVPEFTEHLKNLRTYVSDGKKENGPVLSTIHGAKGTEYDTVYIINAFDGTLPADNRENTQGEQSETQAEEERRLFYVAMTRAKNSLNIFTYTSKNYETSFSDEVFGKTLRRKLEKRHGAALNASKKYDIDTPLRLATYSVQDAGGEREFFSNDSVTVGGRFVHTKFGSFSVTSRTGDTIVAEFEDGKTRKLSVSHLVKANLISDE